MIFLQSETMPHKSIDATHMYYAGLLKLQETLVGAYDNVVRDFASNAQLHKEVASILDHIASGLAIVERSKQEFMKAGSPLRKLDVVCIDEMFNLGWKQALARQQDALSHMLARVRVKEPKKTPDTLPSGSGN